MASFVFTYAAGKFNEKVSDAPTTIGVLLLKVAEADATLRDYATIAALLAGSNTEADATNYARKTGLTGTVTVDTANNRISLDIPDQTFSALGNGATTPGTGSGNNALVKLVTFIDEGGTDATRIPISGHDAVINTNGADLAVVINASGLARATAS